MRLLRKATPESICGDLLKCPDKETWLYRIAGVVTGYETGTTQYGDWIQPTGEFSIIRFDTGEEMSAVSCHLVCGLDEMIASKLDARRKTDPHADVPIAFDIGIKQGKQRKPDDPPKYEFVVRLVISEDVKNARIAALMNAAPIPSNRMLPPG